MSKIYNLREEWLLPKLLNFPFRYCGKEELKSDSRRKIVVDGNNHSLVIGESAVEDSGTYSCKAINKVGEATQKATVTVKCKFFFAVLFWIECVDKPI